jgi:pyruvate,orthophosphate dikinase
MVTKRKSSARKKIQRTTTRSKSRVRAAVRGKGKKTPRYVYYFGDGHADGAGSMKPLLGGKGANLHNHDGSVQLFLRS